MRDLRQGRALGSMRRSLRMCRMGLISVSVCMCRGGAVRHLHDEAPRCKAPLQESREALESAGLTDGRLHVRAPLCQVTQRCSSTCTGHSLL